MIPIPIAISARHVHLTQATVEKLFGTGWRLHPRNPLSQPGEYAAEETVTLIGPQGRLEHVRIVGPPRAEDQIELSRTDELALGLDVPLRISGDLRGTPGIVIEGPAGRLQTAHGAIRALRHIHMTPEDARRLKLRDGETTTVAIDSDGRDLVFGDVRVRVSPHYRLELHLDTDEGNAAGLRTGATALLLPPI